MPVRVTFQGQPLLESVIKGKRKLRDVINDSYRPNRALMESIGQEIIEGFKGGRGLFVENITFTKNGFMRGGQRGKPYPYGIRREKSPDGTPYADLKEVTKKFKRKDGSHFVNSILQNRGGTDPESLINSLEYRITYSSSKSAGVSGGVEVYFARNNDRSWKLERGGDFISKDLANPKIRTLPPRPHREVQDMVRRQITSLLRKWAAKNR